MFVLLFHGVCYGENVMSWQDLTTSLVQDKATRHCHAGDWDTH